MAFLYSILPEYTKSLDILTDSNYNGSEKTLEAFLDEVDIEVFDNISNSIREILSFYDINTIKDEYLHYFAYLIGYKWNVNLDFDIQKEILRNMLELYKHKGTKFSFNFHLSLIDPNVTLYEPYKDIFILNESNFEKASINYNFIIWREPVKAVVIENITLETLLEIDGYQTKIDDRILVINQTDLTENGVYRVKASSWIRTDDCSDITNILNSVFYVQNGLINKNHGYICSSITDDEIVFEQLDYTKIRTYHLTSRNYYSWGVLILRVDSATSDVYELFSMVRPSGWKIIVETSCGLYYNIHYKLNNVNRTSFITQLNLNEDDFEDYDEFINSIMFSDFKRYFTIVMMGQTFSLYGNNFVELVDNFITLTDLEEYNLYYESPESDLTLFRYSKVYGSYESEVLTP